MTKIVSERRSRPRGVNAENRGAAFREVGLDPNAGWINSAVMYGTGGAIGLSLNFFVPGFDWAWQALAAAWIALISSPVFVWASRNLAPDGVSAHFRMVFGIGLMAWVLWFAPESRGAIWPILIFTVLAPAMLHRGATACAYAAASVVVAGSALLASPESSARVVVGLTVLTMLAVGILSQQQGVRRVAILNRRLSMVDALTGVGNMRLLRERLQARIDRGVDDGASAIRVIAIDLDKFKQVNDLHSHAVGDRMIRDVAQAILSTVRDDDLVARRGGDEFYIVPGELAGGSPDRLIARVKGAIQSARIGICSDLPATASIGCVERKPGESLESLLTRADDAMHCEKRLAAAGERLLAAKDDRGPSHAAAALADAETSTVHQTVADNASSSRWNWAASMYGVCATLGLAMAVGGIAPEMAGTFQFVVIGSLFALAFWCLSQGRADLPPGTPLQANGLGLVLLTALIFSSKKAGPDFADVLMLPIVYMFIFERRTIALASLGMIAVIYAAALVAGGDDQTTTRIVATIFVLAAAGLRLAGTQVIIEEFINRNVVAAEIDPLTGIANVRGLRKLVTSAVTNAGAKRLVIFAIDLDDFKQVNDLHSHQVGDKTLKATAAAITRAIGDHGTAARRGGDEFSAICEVDSLGEAADLAVAISGEIESARSAICKDVLPTASVAFIDWDESESASEFLVRADDELHRTKAASHERRAGDRVMYGATA